MGYTTEFSGEFQLSRQLYPTHAAYLTRFAGIRHMARLTARLEEGPVLKPGRGGVQGFLAAQQADFAAFVSDGEALRKAVGLPFGNGGQYFIGDSREFGQKDDSSIIDYNRPPSGVPGLWCGWVPSKDRWAIVWNGAEKFYDYVEWLEYLIEHFLKPWGYELNGRVNYIGEDPGDYGYILVKSNVVEKVENKT